MQFVPDDWKQQLPGALSAMSPLLMAMSRGMLSGQGAFTYAPQGLAAMQLQGEKRSEAEKKKADMEAFSGLLGGQFPRAAASRKPVTRNAAMAKHGGPTKAAAANLNFDGLEQQYNLPQGYLARTAQIESAGNPNAKNPNSSATGPFQFIDSTARQYGLTDRTDWAASADAAARLAADNASHLRNVLGREPTAGELYLAHQQGAGGAAKLLSNPNARAIDVVGAEALQLNGGTADMTAGQFAQKWTGKFGGGGQAQQPRQYDPQVLAQVMASEHIPAAAKAQIMQQVQGPSQMDQIQMQLAQAQLEKLQSPAEPKPTEAQMEIQRLMSIGFDEKTAIKIKEGVIRIQRDPITQETFAFDLESMQPVPLPGQAAPQGAPGQQAPAPQPQAPAPQAPPTGDARGAFGLPGVAANAVNTVTDAIGAGAAFPQQQSAKADADVLREQLTNDIASGYGRQPPSWLLRNIQELTPQAASLQGPDGAYEKLRALSDSLAGEAASLEKMLGRKMAPSQKQKVEARLQAIQTAIGRTEQFMARLAPGGETQKTQSGVQWRIVE